MKVLNNLDFSTYDPEVLCIEILGYRHLNSLERENAIKLDKIYQFLVNKNYKKVWSGPSYSSHIFVK